MKNLFVSNLGFKVTADDLRGIFEEHGEVISAKVITDAFTGRSRGFGFVEMQSNEEADKAIQELNEAELDGRVMSVSVARPKGESRSGSGERTGSYDRQRNNRY